MSARSTADGSAVNTLAALAAAAGDTAVSRETVDGLVARWLFGQKSLLGENTIADLSDPDLVALPGWGRAPAAERLMTQLLPGWTFARGTGIDVVLQPPAGSKVRSTISGRGPSFARALLAATFNALTVEAVLGPALGPMDALRAALEQELADG